MAASLNKIQIIGNLGKDPGLRYLPSGKAFTNISVATTEKWKDKDGQLQDKTEWHRVNLFGSQAEVAAEYLKKGSAVYIEGRLETREWEKDGVKRYSTEINASDMKMLDGRKEAQHPAQAAPAQQQKPREMAKAIDEDDIPF